MFRSLVGPSSGLKELRYVHMWPVRIIITANPSSDTVNNSHTIAISEYILKLIFIH